MSMAIVTKYIGWTDTKSARIKAIARKAEGAFKEMSVTVDATEGPCAAAKACAEKYGWTGLYVRGDIDGGTAWVKLPGSYSTAWIEKYIPGTDGEDWFVI